MEKELISTVDDVRCWMSGPGLNIEADGHADRLGCEGSELVCRTINDGVIVFDFMAAGSSASTSESKAIISAQTTFGGDLSGVRKIRVAAHGNEIEKPLPRTPHVVAAPVTALVGMKLLVLRPGDPDRLDYQEDRIQIHIDSACRIENVKVG